MQFTRLTRSALQSIVAIATALTTVVACGEDPLAPPAPLASPESVSLSPTGNAYTFTTLDVPGATVTAPQGINADGAVVGSFRDVSGTHGFVLRSGSFTTIDYPGAAFTEARGISSDGTIVGTYRLPGEPAVNVHGFRRTPQGEFTKADYAGHTSTIAQRILDDGTILGCRHDADLMESMRGVVIGRTGNSETTAFASMHNGATPDRRRIAGLYTNMTGGTTGRTEGYVIDDGVFRTILVPGSTFTSAWDVSPQGDVVGVFRDASNVFHGFVLTREGFRSLDVPGATATRSFGINRAGDVVGAFVDAGGVTRGFVARRAR